MNGAKWRMGIPREVAARGLLAKLSRRTCPRPNKTRSLADRVWSGVSLSAPSWCTLCSLSAEIAMKTLRRSVALALLSAALPLFGCQAGPTIPAPAPSGPAFNGLGFGSGHSSYAPQESGTAAASEETTAGADTTSNRRGLGFGSGH